MRRVRTTVPMEEAKRRALLHLRGRPMEKASRVAYAIWPETNFTSQGAGASASRVLRLLIKDSLVRWDRDADDWGYSLTSKGVAKSREHLQT
jgi:hypothetical protein